MTTPTLLAKPQHVEACTDDFSNVRWSSARATGVETENLPGYRNRGQQAERITVSIVDGTEKRRTSVRTLIASIMGDFAGAFKGVFRANF